MLKLMAAALVAGAVATGARAGPDHLWDTLRLDELLAIMAEEGRAYGADLADQLFPGGGGPTWEARVAGLYDPEAMAAGVRPVFVAAFDGIDTDGLEAFFTSPLGRRIVDSELEARRAFLDPEVEAAASEAVETLREEAPQRYDLMRTFVAANDLVENNVAASLTFSYAFNLGLVDGGMESLSRDDALQDAWSQEAAVRRDTNRWLDAQLSVVFAPFSDGEVQRYTALSQTDGGEALNAALFQAFEPTFTRIARGLGEAVARSLEGSDI